MVGVSPHDEVAAEARTGHDRLHVIVVELARAELEVHLPIFVPDGEEAVLCSRSLDEGVVRRDAVGASGCRGEGDRETRDRACEKMTQGHRRAGWRARFT